MKHLMENLRDHYRIELEEAAIVENVDNCIDERYSEIQFIVDEGKLEILMTGDGMSSETFWITLPQMAATTKESISGALGRYGWGMKVCLWVAEKVDIETKKGNFHGAQAWKLIKGIPYWKKEEPKKSINSDFTCVTIKLNDEYKEKITPELIIKTLQNFYPTVLRGAPVRNRYGEKRVLKMIVNGHVVDPPPEILYEKRKPIVARIGNDEATGYIYLSKEPLPEEEKGIWIIVHGRKIINDFFGYYDDKITGYIHADFLIKDLRGDKTQLIKTHRWRKLSEAIAQQLKEFMNEIGTLREQELPKDIVKRIHIEINELVRHFPELQELAKKLGIGISQDVLIPKKEGDIQTTFDVGSKRERGLEAGQEGGEGVPVKPGEDQDKAPTTGVGEGGAEKRKRKRGIEIKRLPSSEKKEAWFTPDGIVFINTTFPTYKKAEKMHSLEYHIERCAIEAILEYAANEGVISETVIKSYKNIVFAKWGEL
jgi:hypothetical protein